MKSVMAIIFSVLFVFAVSSVSFAVEEKEAKPKIPAEVTKLPGAAKIRQITGSVRAVNTNAMTITVTKKLKRKVVEAVVTIDRSEEHTSELQSRLHLVCRLLLEKT